MPIYRFKCLTCGHTEEEFYHITEQKPEVCPQCQNTTFQQELGLTADWFPHPIIFQKNDRRQKAVAEAAHLMVKNGDDHK